MGSGDSPGLGWWAEFPTVSQAEEGREARGRPGRAAEPSPSHPGLEDPFLTAPGALGQHLEAEPSRAFVRTWAANTGVSPLPRLLDSPGKGLCGVTE